MSSDQNLPDGLIAYGPDANCTLSTCPLSASVYEYRPTIPGNSVIIALFGISMIIHIIQGVMYRSWIYMTVIVLGCISELVGYGGRIMLNQNPYSFNGFLIQISKFESACTEIVH